MGEKIRYKGTSPPKIWQSMTLPMTYLFLNRVQTSTNFLFCSRILKTNLVFRCTIKILDV